MNEFTPSSQRLSYTHRLHHSWEYRKFFQNSEVYRLSACTVFRIRNSLPHFRLGITLKARGSSIERNRIKRQIRESMRIMPEVLGPYDYNVVIPASKRIERKYAADLSKALRNELPKAIFRS